MRRLSLPPALHRPLVLGVSGLCTSLVLAALSSTAVARPPQPTPVLPAANTPPGLQLAASPEPSKPVAAEPVAPVVIPESKPPVLNSEMDAQLFYQLMVAEMQMRQGQPGVGYQIYLETARRRGDQQLFRRAVDIAIQARAGEQALAAAQAWREAFPQSLEANQFASQIQLVMGRTDHLAEALSSLLKLTPADQLGATLLSLPRSLQRVKDRAKAAELIDQVTTPWRHPPNERVEAWVASGEGWSQAQQPDKALAALQRALALEPLNIMAGLQAVELIDQTPAAQALVDTQLKRPDAPSLVRLTLLER